MFIDYQLSRVASPVTDISYALCLSGDLEVFENHLRDFFKTYYKTLETSLERMGCSLEKCYPKDIYREQVRSKIGFGLMMALCGIPMVCIDKGQVLHSTDDYVNQLEEGTYGNHISDLAAERLNGLVDVFVKNGFI